MNEPVETAQDIQSEETTNQTVDQVTTEQGEPEQANSPQKASREAARYRTQLRDLEAKHAELEQAHAQTMQRLERLQWESLDAAADNDWKSKTHRARSTQLQKLGHTIDEFQNEEGTLNTEAYIKAVNDVAKIAGWRQKAGAPALGYQPTNGPTDSSRDKFKATLAGDVIE